jgi:ligand-binding SRPBCC domain-containing protein
MKEFQLERTQTLPLALEQVWAFFSDPRNLAEITPPWLNFRMVSMSTPQIGEGTRIDYRLRVRGIPLRWRSLIRDWDPPHRFIDEQLKGPYRRWIHEHRFERTDEGTRVTDRVRYSVLGGALVERFLVRPDVERIFEWRTRRLEELLLARGEVASAPDAVRAGRT